MTLLRSRLAPLAARASSFVSRASGAAAVAKRRAHTAAAGTFHAFNDPAEIARLTEPTMVSSFYSRAQALKENKELPATEAALAASGHRVAYGVDVTQLHNPANAAVSEMMADARKFRIDMSTLSMSYLRSQEETPSADSALLGAASAAAYRSGVRTMTITHRASKFAHSAPSEAQWVPAATGAGYTHVETREERRERVVESVLRDGGNKLEKSRVKTVGVSTFKKL